MRTEIASKSCLASGVVHFLSPPPPPRRGVAAKVRRALCKDGEPVAAQATQRRAREADEALVSRLICALVRLSLFLRPARKPPSEGRGFLHYIRAPYRLGHMIAIRLRLRMPS